MCVFIENPTAPLPPLNIYTMDETLPSGSSDGLTQGHGPSSVSSPEAPQSNKRKLVEDSGSDSEGELAADDEGSRLRKKGLTPNTHSLLNGGKKPGKKRRGQPRERVRGGKGQKRKDNPEPRFEVFRSKLMKKGQIIRRAGYSLADAPHTSTGWQGLKLSLDERAKITGAWKDGTIREKVKEFQLASYDE